MIAYFTQLKAQKELDFLREDLPALLTESRDGLSRVRNIIKSLNSFAEGDDHQWQLADINQCLDTTLDIFASEKNAYCVIHKQYADIPAIYCLPIQLKHVFLSLLINASQAMDKSGNITIRSGCDNAEQVWVEFADDGHGVAPEHLKHLFEPFFTTRPLGQGIGLGLSTAQNIIAAHHGKIEVDSTPGQGSLFKIRLPIKQPS
jgi:signal transduction histidine kinase